MPLNLSKWALSENTLEGIWGRPKAFLFLLLDNQWSLKGPLSLGAGSRELIDLEQFLCKFNRENKSFNKRIFSGLEVFCNEKQMIHVNKDSQFKVNS